LLYYRKAADDIHQPLLSDLLDDDPWIRTTDISPCGALLFWMGLIFLFCF